MNGIVMVLFKLAEATRAQGEVAQAAGLYRESLALAWEQGDQVGVADALLGLAAIAAAGGEYEWAARLLGAAEARRGATGADLDRVSRATWERTVGQVGAALEEAAVAAAWAAGRRLSPAAAVAEAVAHPAPPGATAPLPAAATALGLTRREVEILRLLVEGCSDRKMAEHLSLSPRTVSNHVYRLLAKLAVESRSAATAYAVRHDLV
jgi:DNA-binding CsgD family transcriptional regulator